LTAPDNPDTHVEVRIVPTFVIALAVVLAAGCGGPGPPDRIVFVVVDTLRRDAIGSYGGQASTPTIDRLASEGQRFTNAIASFHQTTMSMGALFTGLTPSLESDDISKSIPFVGRTWCGLARFDPQSTRTQCIPLEVPTLGGRMRDAGYWSIGITSNALLFDPHGLSRGFDDWIQVGESVKPITSRRYAAAKTSRTASRVNASVKTALERRQSDRFFLYVHYMEAHDYFSPESLVTATIQRRNEYRQAVENVDRAVDELLAIFEELKLLDDTVIVLTSDHGERLGEKHVVNGNKTHMGNPSFEEVLEVPLIVWPARFEKPDALVRGTDMFGMITTLAGASPPPLPQLESTEVFTSEREWLTYRKDNWKSYTRRTQRGLFLIDLETDPHERVNVAKRNPEIAQLHWDRVSALATELSVSSQSHGSLSEPDRERLRLLGYFELAGDAPAPRLTWKQRKNPGFRAWRPPDASRQPPAP
jgi:arylsulfatase A-like enzyme